MNEYRVIDKQSLIVTSIILFLILVACGLMSIFVLNDPAIKYSQVMIKAAMAIRDDYHEPVDLHRLFDSARRAMTDELDRFSGYVDHEALAQFEEDLSGGYFGVGISVISHDLGLLIMEVRGGSPAAQAELLNGDIIIASDTISLTGLSAPDAIKLIKGEENTTLSATIYRPASNDTLEVRIVRKRVEFLHIPFAGITHDSFIYLRLLDFNSGAAQALRASLDSLLDRNQTGLKGLILDLRDNPGGLFSEARQIAELFLKKGSFVVGTSSRSKWREENYSVENSGGFEQLPVAILVNRGSASAAEILAGALRFSNQAILIGDTTFGKGLVQGFVNLPDGDGLRLTISRYFFDQNRYINPIDSMGRVSDSGTGLVPDIHYSFVEENPFVLALERSLLLYEFAHKFQDQLFAAANSVNEEQRWLNDFKQFTVEQGFNYESSLTLQVKEFLSLAESKPMREMAYKTLKHAQMADEQLFNEYGKYIGMRLREIACERKAGTYAAYREIIVPESELISLAAAALKDRAER